MYLQINSAKFKKILTLGTSIVILSSGSWFIFNKIEESSEPKEIIQATIHLVNYCAVSNNAFMMQSIPEGPRAFFGGSKVNIMAPEGQKMQLVASSRYPDFSFEGPMIRLAEENTVIADCEGKGPSTLEGLKGKF
tara:strand:- start:65 stop:469 length:405 start_codon:yes stop_codon:yes gene_type:complete